METFLIATGLVALAELGDKTQLLALMLAARYRQPLPIILGIAAATLLNHALAAFAGQWLSGLVSYGILKWGVGLLFIALGVWTLVPDKLDDKDGAARPERHGVFLTTLINFFWWKWVTRPRSRPLRWLRAMPVTRHRHGNHGRHVARQCAGGVCGSKIRRSAAVDMDSPGRSGGIHRAGAVEHSRLGRRFDSSSRVFRT